jgi:surface polysaccharide O-acyltransferase-like enzyme
MMHLGLLGPIKLAYWDLINRLKDPVKLIMQGTRAHLWFLLSLLEALGITCLLVWKKRNKLLIVISIILFLICCLGTGYSDTPFGIHTNIMLTQGPFLGTIFFVTGYFLSNLTPNQGWF